MTTRCKDRFFYLCGQKTRFKDAHITDADGVVWQLVPGRTIPGARQLHAGSLAAGMQVTVRTAAGKVTLPFDPVSSTGRRGRARFDPSSISERFGPDAAAVYTRNCVDALPLVARESRRWSSRVASAAVEQTRDDLAALAELVANTNLALHCDPRVFDRLTADPVIHRALVSSLTSGSTRASYAAVERALSLLNFSAPTNSSVDDAHQDDIFMSDPEPPASGTEIAERVERFVLEACRIQHATRPSDIAAMREMFRAAALITPADVVRDVVRLGNILDPTITALRNSPAVFASSREAVAPIHVPRRLDALVEFVESLEGTERDALEAYWAFEEIHPIADGNGRVGMVLYNAIRGSLADPVIPKDREVW